MVSESEHGRAFELALAALVAVNAASFLVFGWDKLRARRGGPRVPERTLLALALILGSPGAWVGSRVFRHKTAKSAFRRKLLLITTLQALALAALLWRRFPSGAGG